jgi:hypothetical protein
LSFLANGRNYKKNKRFSLLDPTYQVDHKGIEEYVKEIIKKEFQ